MNRFLYMLMALLLAAGACKKNQDRVQQPLAVTSFFPTSGMSHTLVTVYGSGFGADTTRNTVAFNGVKASILQVTDSSLVVLAPDNGSTGAVSVTADGKTITAGTFTYQLLSLHSVSPLNGPAGTNVVISGAGLSGKTGPATVSFNGRPAVVVSSNDTSLVVAVPDSAGTGPIVATVDGSTATGPVFTYQAISFINPVSGGAGTLDSIHGTGFGPDAAKDIVTCNGVGASVTAISDTMIVIRMPAGVQTGPVAVSINGQKTVGPAFTVVPAPVITTITPASGLAGAVVTITGKYFSTAAAQDQVDFNGIPSVTNTASATQLTVTVPAGVTTGNIHVSVNGQLVQGPVFTVQVLNITALSPNNGLEGTPVTISGNGFSTTPSDNQVFFNGVAAVVTTATATQLTVTAPAGLSTGNVTIQVGGLQATGPLFSRQGVSTVLSFLGSNNYFTAMAIDGQGNVYYVLTTDNAIHMVSPDGTQSVFAGSTTQSGFADGTGAAALFSQPNFLSFDKQGNLFVGDNGNQKIRMVTPAGKVSTIITGVNDIVGITFDPANQGYFEAQNYFGPIVPGVFKFNLTGSYTSAFTQTGQNTDLNTLAADGAGALYAGHAFSNNVLTKVINGTPQNINTSFNYIEALVTDPATGNIIVIDKGTNTLSMVDRGTNAATPLTPRFGYGQQDGTLEQATFYSFGISAIDAQGNVYVVDQQQIIRKITLK